MDQLSGRLAVLGVAATFVVAGVVAVKTTPDYKAFGWVMIWMGVTLAAGGYVVDAIAARQRLRPAVSSPFRYISSDIRRGYDTRAPYAFEVRFKARRPLQPTRFEVICDAPVQSAAAVMEVVQDSQLKEGYAFTTKVSDSRVYVGFSNPQAHPRFDFLVEVRSPSPIAIRRVRAVKVGPLEEDPHNSAESWFEFQ